MKGKKEASWCPIYAAFSPQCSQSMSCAVENSPCHSEKIRLSFMLYNKRSKCRKIFQLLEWICCIWIIFWEYQHLSTPVPSFFISQERIFMNWVLISMCIFCFSWDQSDSTAGSTFTLHVGSIISIPYDPISHPGVIPGHRTKRKSWAHNNNNNNNKKNNNLLYVYLCVHVCSCVYVHAHMCDVDAIKCKRCFQLTENGFSSYIQFVPRTNSF